MRISQTTIDLSGRQNSSKSIHKILFVQADRYQLNVEQFRSEVINIGTVDLLEEFKANGKICLFSRLKAFVMRRIRWFCAREK